MAIQFIFWKLEIKRGLQRIPQMLAGVVVLLFLGGTTALFASRALYGDQAAGRIPVAVSLPQEELLAKKALSMIASLDSVKSMCDFVYQDRETALEMLGTGEVYAVMEVPEGLVQGIMDGTNAPVRIYFPANAGVESRIFQELTDAGAGILSAAQAGIYAGNQLCGIYGLESQIPRLEQDLNQIFLAYSLPREDYFRYMQVQATGDLDPARFYGVSAYILILLLCGVPVSGYLLPYRPVLGRKLRMAGLGPLTQVLARTVGLGVLLILATGMMVAALAAAPLVWIVVQRVTGMAAGPLKGSAGMVTDTAAFTSASGGSFSGTPGEASLIRIFFPEGAGVWDSLPDKLLLAGTLILVCLAVAAVVVLLYRLAGNLLGGILLLFLLATVQHYLAGGFLPLVFLPATVKGLAPVLPSGILMDAMAMALTAHWDGMVFARLGLLAAGAVGLAALGQAGGEQS